MIKMSEIRKNTEVEIALSVAKARETLRLERFKDKFSRKANVITGAKKEIAQLLTELSARRRNPNVK